MLTLVHRVRTGRDPTGAAVEAAEVFSVHLRPADRARSTWPFCDLLMSGTANAQKRLERPGDSMKAEG